MTTEIIIRQNASQNSISVFEDGVHQRTVDRAQLDQDQNKHVTFELVRWFRKSLGLPGD